MTVQPPTVFLIGDVGHRDFRAAVQWLREHTVLQSFAKFDEAAAAAADCQPRAIVIAQSRPGQFRQSQIESLYSASPLSHLVLLLGSWCEGELRTGQPLRGMVRVMWHQWAAHANRELSNDASPRLGQWSMPRTTTPGERFTALAGQTLPRGEGLIAIHTPTKVNFDGLSDACRLGGYATVWLNQTPPRSIHGLSAIVWDAVACDEASTEQLRKIAAADRDVPVLGLLDFVRRQDYDAAVAAGAAEVLAKPFLLADLHGCLHGLGARSSGLG